MAKKSVTPTEGVSQIPQSPASIRPNTGSKSWLKQLLAPNSDNMLFTARNYRTFALGIILIVVGFLLMSGGGMPDPNTWDESIIYSPRRITLAPIVVIAGLVTVVVGIFR